MAARWAMFPAAITVAASRTECSSPRPTSRAAARRPGPAPRIPRARSRTRTTGCARGPMTLTSGTAKSRTAIRRRTPRPITSTRCAPRPPRRRVSARTSSTSPTTPTTGSRSRRAASRRATARPSKSSRPHRRVASSSASWSRTHPPSDSCSAGTPWCRWMVRTPSTATRKPRSMRSMAACSPTTSTKRMSSWSAISPASSAR